MLFNAAPDDGYLMYGKDMAALYAAMIMDYIRVRDASEPFCYYDIALANDWTHEELQQGLKRLEDFYQFQLPVIRVTYH